MKELIQRNLVLVVSVIFMIALTVLGTLPADGSKAVTATATAS